MENGSCLVVSCWSFLAEVVFVVVVVSSVVLLFDGGASGRDDVDDENRSKILLLVVDVVVATGTMDGACPAAACAAVVWVMTGGVVAHGYSALWYFG